MLSFQDYYLKNIKNRNFKLKNSKLNQNEYNKIFLKFLNVKKVKFNYQSSKEEDNSLGGINPIKFFNNRRKNYIKRTQSPIPYLINKFSENNNNNNNLNKNNKVTNNNNDCFNLYYYYNSNINSCFLPKYSSN